MLVYEDMISGDGVLSDSFKMDTLVFNGEEVKGIKCVQSSLVAKDIGSINTGGNDSAEGGGDEVDDTIEKVVDIKDAMMGFGYEGPIEMKAADFQVLFKSWCKAVKGAIEEKGGKPKEFMQSAKAFLPFFKAEFKNFEIYHPKSYNISTFIIGWWDEDANMVGAPKFIYFEHALTAIKY